MKAIEEYSRMIDEMAWYGKGSILEIGKLAKKLNRNYMQDLAERKKIFIEANEISKMK